MTIALVTGGNRGIGASVAHHLATCGMTVYAGQRNLDNSHGKSIQHNGMRKVQLDVTDDDSVRAAVDHICDRHGTIDLLVNNAGVAWFAPAEEMSDFVLRTTMETNFFGAVRCTQAVLPKMRARGHGAIITISSLAGTIGLPLESAYCASKAAIETYHESVRVEMAPFGVKVAVVEPGITEGGLSNSIPDPNAPKSSLYAELLEHTFDYYSAAQDERESPKLITDAIDTILADASPDFRHPLGDLAPLVKDIANSPQQKKDSMLTEALQLEFWTARAESPALSNV